LVADGADELARIDELYRSGFGLAAAATG